MVTPPAALPATSPAIRTVAMPCDTNPAGDIFGGWLMWQMDLAAELAATRRARGRCATVAVEAITFLSPVQVGDEVSLYADVTSTGRTSMRIAVQAWRRKPAGRLIARVGQGTTRYRGIGLSALTRHHAERRA